MRPKGNVEKLSVEGLCSSQPRLTRSSRVGSSPGIPNPLSCGQTARSCEPVAACRVFTPTCRSSEDRAQRCDGISAGYSSFTDLECASSLCLSSWSSNGSAELVLDSKMPRPYGGNHAVVIATEIFGVELDGTSQCVPHSTCGTAAFRCGSTSVRYRTLLKYIVLQNI